MRQSCCLVAVGLCLAWFGERETQAAEPPTPQEVLDGLKKFWQKTARLATPHEGYHRMYGSFASNSPVTDGRYVYASFGSRGVYCFDLNGKLVWQKDLGVQMRMRLQFGEGVAPVLDRDRLILTFDQEADSFIVALDKQTGKELWRAARAEVSSWSTPLVIDHDLLNEGMDVVEAAFDRLAG